jgi:hypothetical protein
MNGTVNHGLASNPWHVTVNGNDATSPAAGGREE